MTDRLEQIREASAQLWVGPLPMVKRRALYADVEWLLSEVVALGERLRVLTEALAHYAAEEYWEVSDSSEAQGWDDRDQYTAGKNGYDVARAALAFCGAPQTDWTVCACEACRRVRESRG